MPYKVHSQLHDDCLQGNVTAVRTQLMILQQCPSACPTEPVVLRRVRRAQVKEALEAGSKYINERRGSAFNTPLHNAATKSNLEIARLLVEVGAAPIQKASPDGTFHVRLGHEVANINAQNEIKATPLMFAAGSNQTEMMLYLMDHGADLLLETESGGTAMHFAVRSNNSELVAAFLDKAAAMSSATAAGDTASTAPVEALDQNAITSEINLVKIVNHANKQGWAPLHFAARQGNAAIAKLLIDRGADIDAVEQRGEALLPPTPYELLRNLSKVLACCRVQFAAGGSGIAAIRGGVISAQERS